MEKVEILNQRLLETYGTSWNNLPMWCIVFSDDMIEKRMVSEVNGVQLLYPEMREVKKYRHIEHKFVLENLVVVPDFQIIELGKEINYEPLWTFEDKHGNALPPKWEVCQLVIASVEAAKGHASDYKVAEKDEDVGERIKQLEADLFGNETSVGDALAHGYGVKLDSTKQFVKES